MLSSEDGEKNGLDKEAQEINRGFYCSWWVARVMGIGVITLIFAVLALSSVIIWLLPLKEIKYSLVTGYNKETQVIKVEPIEKTTYGWNKLMEILSKQFVVDLHTLDGQTEEQRLKKLSLMVDEETREFVENQLNMSKHNSSARKVLEAGVKRSVNIKSITNLAPEAPNTWQVEWEGLENDVNAEVQRRNHFISTITAETQEKTVHSGEEELNPVGYTVTRYSLRMGTP